MFVANFGGIFGLCLGGSIISLIEIGYFVLIRILGRILMQLVTKLSNKKKIRNKLNRIRTITENIDSLSNLNSFYIK